MSSPIMNVNSRIEAQRYNGSRVRIVEMIIDSETMMRPVGIASLNSVKRSRLYIAVTRPPSPMSSASRPKIKEPTMSIPYSMCNAPTISPVVI